jgi:hypothetical protein
VEAVTGDAPPRQWFRADDGSYYRNCPLIRSESDQVMAWPMMTPGKYALLRELGREWDAVYGAGVTRKAQLEPGDVAAEPAPFRDAYPRNPGLWVLDD